MITKTRPPFTALDSEVPTTGLAIWASNGWLRRWLTGRRYRLVRAVGSANDGQWLADEWPQ